jgi:amino acid transporter
VSTDETEHRTGMERRATEDDGARLRAEQESHVRGEQESHVRGDEAGTRPMRTEGAAETAAAERTRATDRPDQVVVEERRVVPGSARGRLHVGINWGAAFFGWVAAMGLAVILTAFVAAVGAAVGVTQGTTTVDQDTTQIQYQDPQTVGIVGIVLLAVIAFVSYYGGGYVAARMSRFDGARQGFAVWLWAIGVALVVAIVAAVAGARFDVLSTLNTFPRLPVDQGNLTGTGIVALVLLLAITLLGAVLGGAGGMRYHRKLESTEAEYLQ